MSWVASGAGFGLAVAHLIGNAWSPVAWLVVGANLVAAVRHYRRPERESDWSLGYDAGVAAGVAAERKRAAQAIRELIASRGGR